MKKTSKKVASKKKPESKPVEAPTTLAISMKDLVPSYTRDTNPNKMSDEEFASLCSLIKEEGFMQTILVSPIPKTKQYRILDGHHRFWACQQAGMTTILAYVKNASEPKGAALGIGLNKNRGELDYALSGMVIQQVMEDTGWTVDQLATLTGFSQSEIEAITTTVQTDVDDLLDDVSSAPPEDEEELEGSAKPYTLEIAFADRAQYQLARRKLRKAAGASKDLAIGLMAVLGEDSDAA